MSSRRAAWVPLASAYTSAQRLNKQVRGEAAAWSSTAKHALLGPPAERAFMQAGISSSRWGACYAAVETPLVTTWKGNVRGGASLTRATAS